VPDVQDIQRSRVADLIVGGIYVVVIGANAWLAYDWWRDTPGGEAVIARLRERIDAVRAKAAECEGCAKRKAAMKGMINRVHWDAERIVEGAEVETTPEP
jgi:hypothetical protein